jgi:hypothetical protein
MRESWQRGSARCQMQKLPAVGKCHGNDPSSALRRRIALLGTATDLARCNIFVDAGAGLKSGLETRSYRSPDLCAKVVVETFH